MDDEMDVLAETVRRAFMGDAQAKVVLLRLESLRAMANDFSQVAIVHPGKNAAEREFLLFTIGEDDTARWTSEPIDSADLESQAQAGFGRTCALASREASSAGRRSRDGDPSDP